MSKDVVLVPEHWYLVRLFYDSLTQQPVTTIVQFLGVDKDDRPTFKGYESLGVADHMEVIREVKEG